jgi:hypothetical protein
MKENVRPLGHLLIAGISFADVEATISFARLILERMPITPAGLLVETRIGSLATGAGHRIISTNGVLLELPSDKQLKKFSKSEARAMESLISQLATERSTRWSCKVAEGDLVVCACSAAEKEDVLLLCQRPMLGFQGNVLLIESAKSHKADVFSVARDLAKASATSVLEVEFGNNADIEELFDRVDRTRATAIVVDLNVGPLTSTEHLKRLLSAARCPVVVMGAGRTRR